GGGTIPIPPISFDFISVDEGGEILGAGVAPLGVTGDYVPRLACRLVGVRQYAALQGVVRRQWPPYSRFNSDPRAVQSGPRSQPTGAPLPRRCAQQDGTQGSIPLSSSPLRETPASGSTGESDAVRRTCRLAVRNAGRHPWVPGGNRYLQPGANAAL